MFESYTLGRSIFLMGFRLRLVLYVDAVAQEASTTLLVDGRITPLGSSPRWWEVSTPEMAKAWLGNINLDRIAEQLWLDQKAAKS